jgi:hypothetical protein
MLNNLGISTYSNGDMYAGEWKNGRYSGKGILYFKNVNKWELDIHEDGIKTQILKQDMGKPLQLRI